jgi:hypothetical protein
MTQRLQDVPGETGTHQQISAAPASQSRQLTWGLTDALINLGEHQGILGAAGESELCA